MKMKKKIWLWTEDIRRNTFLFQGNRIIKEEHNWGKSLEAEYAIVNKLQNYLLDLLNHLYAGWTTLTATLHVQNIVQQHTNIPELLLYLLRRSAWTPFTIPASRKCSWWLIRIHSSSLSSDICSKELASSKLPITPTESVITSTAYFRFILSKQNVSKVRLPIIK